MIGWGNLIPGDGWQPRVTATQASVSRPSTAGAWSLLLVAAWLTPERLRPWWPSPDTWNYALHRDAGRRGVG